jgi:peroxiredoxin
LRERKDDFDRLNTQIAVVTFTGGYWADHWLKDTGVDFPLLIDENNDLYDSFDLKRSFWKTWQPKVILDYAKRLVKGESLKQSSGDPYQMGGDFIIDTDGIVRLAYRSDDPTDRPPVDDLLKVLERIEH